MHVADIRKIYISVSIIDLLSCLIYFINLLIYFILPSQLKMQQNNHSEAMAIFQRCLRAQTDPAELIAAQEEAIRREAEEAKREAMALEEVDDDYDEPEEFKDKWDEIVAENMEEDYDGDDDAAAVPWEDPLQTVALLSVPVNSKIEPSLTRPYTISDGLFKVFDQAFVTTCLACDDQSGQESPGFIRVFLLYNMGLCVHLQCENALYPQALPQALNIYTTALQELERCFRQGKREDVMMLLLALFNNIAHIHAEYTYNASEVKRCIECIRSLLNARARSPADFRRHGPADLTFFAMSASIASDSIFTTAGAA